MSSILDILARAAIGYILEEDCRRCQGQESARVASVAASPAARAIRGMSAIDAYFDSDKVELAGKIVAIAKAHLGDASVMNAALDKLNEIRATCRFSSSKNEINNYIMAIAAGKMPEEE